MAPKTCRDARATVGCVGGATAVGVGSVFVSTQRSVTPGTPGAAPAKLGVGHRLDHLPRTVSSANGFFSAAAALSSPAAVAVSGVLASRRRAAGKRTVPSKARGGARGGEAVTLAPQDQWIGEFSLEAFGKEVHELGERLKEGQGEADNKHLKKMIWWSRLCAIVGLATMWMRPNPFTVMALSLWTHSAWTMIGHHVCHGGYNRTDSTGRYTSRGFALGSLFRRVQDWFDWMLPEAWGVEHNNLHHYRLGEDADPDLVERNVGDWKGFQRYTMPFLSMLLWKWAYYAPNTYKEMKIAEMRKKRIPLPEGFDAQAPVTMTQIAKGKVKGVFTLWEFVSKVVGPYFLFRFFILPAPLLFFGASFYLNGMANMFLADIASNIHGFIVIVTNHAGNDLYRFASGCKPKSPTFYLRAITSSANFHAGGDINDFMHGWLNYQIEHHCWPDLSMLAYQKGQPELKAICKRYGVPYVQESVWIRLKKTMDIAMGRTMMRRYPLELERPEDMMVWNDEKVRTSSS